MIPTLRLLEHVHGHLGWLAAAALWHPAIVLRRPRRRAPLAVGLATLVTACAWALGVSVYPEYRARLKQRIFLEAPSLGWCFERKEHLAVGVAVFTLVGAIAHLVAPRLDDAKDRELADRLAHRSFFVAALLSMVVGALGVAVASFKSF